MEWKESLRKLERNKQWDEAIEFMQEVIAQNQDDMDAYIAINYLLMNLIVEFTNTHAPLRGLTLILKVKTTSLIYARC